MTYIQYNTNPKSLSGRRIHRLVTHLMISILVSACSPTTSEPGKKSIELDVYEINNDLVQIIIDDEVLSYVHENPKRFKGMYFYILERFEKGSGRYFYVYGVEIEDNTSLIEPGCGWFERGEYQFVVAESAEKYFKNTTGAIKIALV